MWLPRDQNYEFSTNNEKIIRIRIRKAKFLRMRIYSLFVPTPTSEALRTEAILIPFQKGQFARRGDVRQGNDVIAVIPIQHMTLLN